MRPALEGDCMPCLGILCTVLFGSDDEMGSGMVVFLKQGDDGVGPLRPCHFAMRWVPNTDKKMITLHAPRDVVLRIPHLVLARLPPIVLDLIVQHNAMPALGRVDDAIRMKIRINIDTASWSVLGWVERVCTVRVLAAMPPRPVGEGGRISIHERAEEGVEGRVGTACPSRPTTAATPSSAA